MPFYLRKSIKVGPFRFNLSKSGIGLSAGVRGLRVGTGPRGHYIHAGANGFYYRASLGSRARGPNAHGGRPPDKSSSSELASSTPEAFLREIESGDVLAMTDCRVQSIVDEINRAARRQRLSIIAPLICIAISIYTSVELNQTWPFIAVPLAFAVGAWIDNFRRATVLFYELSPDVLVAYGKVVDTFQAIAQCNRLWHISAGGKIADLGTRKRSAGAELLVKRTRTSAATRLPSVVRCNLDPPSVQVGKQELFFFPDFLLVLSGNHAGAISYPDLGLRYQQTQFIETEGVAADATVVGRTWKYVNKNGGPDRRFQDNYEIPICLYDALHLTSQSGLNELLQTSKPGTVEPFARAIAQLAPISKPAQSTSAPETAARQRAWGPVAAWIGVSAVCAPALVIAIRQLVVSEPPRATVHVVAPPAAQSPIAPAKPPAPVQPALTTGSMRPAEPATSPPLGFEVLLAFKVDTGKAVLSGTTNLPDRTELSVIARIGGKVVLTRSATVASGSFALIPFKIPEQAGSDQKTIVEVRTKTSSAQPPSVQAMIGSDGDRLKGPVKRGSTGTYVSVSRTIPSRPKR